VGDLPFHSADACRLAAELCQNEVGMAAHALGWPDIYQITARKGRHLGRIRWRNPYRNYYNAAADDPGWARMIALGAATVLDSGPHLKNVYYCMTPLGIAAVRARLRAAIDAQRAASEARDD